MLTRRKNETMAASVTNRTVLNPQNAPIPNVPVNGLTNWPTKRTAGGVAKVLR